MNYNIDYSDGTTVGADSLDEAIATAQAQVRESGGTATIYDPNDKSVGFITADVVQTLATDPGF